eukprot:2193096-Ditylum_brightwellii.AAC.1
MTCAHNRSNLEQKDRSSEPTGLNSINEGEDGISNDEEDIKSSTFFTHIEHSIIVDIEFKQLFPGYSYFTEK